MLRITPWIAVGLGIGIGMSALGADSTQTQALRDRIADVLIQRLEVTASERLCRPFGKFLAERSADADTSAEQNPLARQWGERAEVFRTACRDRVQEAFDSPRSPKAQVLEELRSRLATVDRRELARIAQFLSSSEGRALGEIEDHLALEAPTVMTPWLSWFGPKLYEDLKLTLTAEWGDLPAVRRAPEPADASTRPRVEVTTARVRSRHLAEDCESFYPAEARRAGQEGLVGLLLAVADNGRLTGVKVETSSGVESLDVAAAACVAAHGEFEPVQVDGRAVASWQRLRWRWVLTESVPVLAPAP